MPSSATTWPFGVFTSGLTSTRVASSAVKTSQSLTSTSITWCRTSAGKPAGVGDLGRLGRVHAVDRVDRRPGPARPAARPRAARSPSRPRPRPSPGRSGWPGRAGRTRSTRSSMSLASVTSTRRTTWPLMSRPRIAVAFSAASSASAASLTPPALPRPPVLTWAFTTTAVPIPAAAAFASSGVSATSPGSTGTPCAAKSSFAWYSYRSTNSSLHAEGTTRHAAVAGAPRSRPGGYPPAPGAGASRPSQAGPERVPLRARRAPPLVCAAVGVDITPVAPVADASLAPGEPPTSPAGRPGHGARRRLGRARRWPSPPGCWPPTRSRTSGSATPLLALPAFAVVAVLVWLAARRLPAVPDTPWWSVLGTGRGRGRLRRLHRGVRVRARGAAPRLGRVRAVRPLDRRHRRADHPGSAALDRRQHRRGRHRDRAGALPDRRPAGRAVHVRHRADPGPVRLGRRLDRDAAGAGADRRLRAARVRRPGRPAGRAALGSGRRAGARAGAADDADVPIDLQRAAGAAADGGRAVPAAGRGRRGRTAGWPRWPAC